MLKKLILTVCGTVLAVSTSFAGVTDSSKLQALKQQMNQAILSFKTIENNSKKCLALAKDKVRVSGSSVVVMNCTGTPNLKWKYENGMVFNPVKLCLQAEPQPNGVVLVKAMTCNGNPRQIWTMQGALAKNGNLCLGVTKNAHNAATQMHRCNAQDPNQLWHLK